MIKGVPPLPLTLSFWAPMGVQKPSKNMQKKKSKNGSTEEENQGPEPQSARAGAVETHFRIF